jgi:hypothetical protein
MRFIHHDAAERAVQQQLSQRDKVRHIAAILIDRENPPPLFGEADEVLGLRERGRKRLVETDVPPGEEYCFAMA